MEVSEKKDAAKKYQVSEVSAFQYPEMVTLVPTDLTKPISPSNPGVPVSLNGKPIERTVAATKESPERKLTIRGATQDELKYLKEVEGNPHIVFV